MEVTVGMGGMMGDPSMDEGDRREDHGPNGASTFDDLELSTRAREMMGKARDWVALNPFAALGIAIATGFIAGRAMRTLAVRL